MRASGGEPAQPTLLTTQVAIAVLVAMLCLARKP